MGDVADMILEGFLDSVTGEVIDGDAPGYPRTEEVDYRPGRKRHKCPTCGKKFGRPGPLSQHRRDKHGFKRAITIPEGE